jgi:hypothetical protein
VKSTSKTGLFDKIVQFETAFLAPAGTHQHSDLYIMSNQREAKAREPAHKGGVLASFANGAA